MNDIIAISTKLSTAALLLAAQRIEKNVGNRTVVLDAVDTIRIVAQELRDLVEPVSA